MEQKSRYQAQIADEETKLRWLITRQPGSLELRYYLLFLLVANELVANERSAQAIKECERILEDHPGDVIAQVWVGMLRRQGVLAHSRQLLRCCHRTQRGRIWGHTSRPSD